jgi:hypothetical protein
MRYVLQLLFICVPLLDIHSDSPFVFSNVREATLSIVYLSATTTLLK